VANDLSKAFSALAKAIKETDAKLTEVAEFAINIIVLRTRKGLDADRQNFAPYTEAYYNHKYFKGKTRTFLAAKAAKTEKRARKALGSAVTDRQKDTADRAFNASAKAKALLHSYDQGRTVDLTVTGHMLGSMVPTAISPGEVTIEFSGTEEIAKALGNSRKRDFFDVRADEELEAIADLFGDMIVAEVMK
jgi:hypothetical protein